MKSLIEYIEKFVTLSPNAIAELERLAFVKSYSKNEFVLREGGRCDKIWFLVEGMVRKFHYTENKEITLWIHTENEIFTSLQSYSQQIPSTEYIQACESSKVIGISKNNSAQLAKINEFMIFTSAMMEREFVNIDIHTKEFNKRDAKGKYEYLNHIAPEIIKRAKLGHIASLLGITQETLSRIRKKK